MKSHLTLLAAGLCGIGVATAQTTTNTYSSTTTNATYVAPVTTDTTQTAAQPAATTNSMNSMNSAAAPAYGTTTVTTTTTSSNVDAATASPERAKDKRAWGKEGKFGVYAGVNFSRFVNEPIPDGAYRAGWQAGIYGRSGGTVFGQVGLEYRNSTSNLVRSGATQPTPTVEDVRDRIDQHFIAIPAYVGLRIGSALGLRVQAGAELAALVAVGNNRFSLGNDDLNRTILNGLAGVGVNLGPLTLDALYNHGFVNVFDNGADTKRRILALNVGFRF